MRLLPLLFFVFGILGGEGLSLAADEVRAVRYEDFGARGDGKTNDIMAIVEAHAHANRRWLPVRADDDATYYIGGSDETAIIRTDTDFGKAAFIIDDTEVENRRAHVFSVESERKSFSPRGITTLRRNQPRIDAEFPGDCVVLAQDSGVKRFIRRGGNRNDGAPQTDVFLVRHEGTVDAETPILWDFERITRIVAFPMDEEPLTISGGRFTTIANRADSQYTYYARGIAIRRSRVVVRGLEHRIEGEGDQGAPYGGFLEIEDCAEVTVRDTTLSGHKTYRTIGNAGDPVSMGTYDITMSRAINVSLVNCRQFNDIQDRSLWGIMASNYCKNICLEGCVLSRFDAHQGVAGAVIRQSTLGHAGINAIGGGTLLVEDTTVLGRHFIYLRSDYGSTWRGDFVIRDCVFVPSGGRPARSSLIGGSNDGQHDFGYRCYMPERITIDGLHIDDTRHPKSYDGPAVLADFNPLYGGADFEERFPYGKTREVILRRVTTASGKPLILSRNEEMFREVRVKRADEDGGTAP